MRLRRRKREGEERIRRGGAFADFCAPVLCVLATGAFLGNSLFSVLEPSMRSRALAKRNILVQAEFVAEDVMLRALAQGTRLRRHRRISLPEGPVSSTPNRLATVELRRIAGISKLLCRLRRGETNLVFLGEHERGQLSPAFAWSLAEGDPEDASDETRGDQAGVERLLVRGARGVLAADSSHAASHPFGSAEVWDQRFDLQVGKTRLRAALRPGVDSNLGNFRDSPALGLTRLPDPTELDVFELGRRNGTRRIAAFRSKHDYVVRVRGHLWVGRAGDPLFVGTGGRAVVIYVDGNLYVEGGIRMLGPRDRLSFVVGRPDWASFRDFDGDGRQGPADPELPARGAGAGGRPREGSGLVYLAREDQDHVRIQASIFAQHDVVVGRVGAWIGGRVLAGGRVLRPDPESDFIEIQPPPLETQRPSRGWPMLPGSERIERLSALKLLGVTSRKASAAPIR